MLEIASLLSLFSRSPLISSPPDRSSRSHLLDRISPLESKKDVGEAVATVAAVAAVTAVVEI